MNNNLYVLKELEDKIDKTQVKNTLTETVEGSVLDARQGKVLNDKVDTKASKQELGTLSGLTTTKKDSLVSALNEVKQSIPSTASINQSIDEKVSTHNQSNTSHQDIRDEIKVLSKDRGYINTKIVPNDTDFNTIIQNGNYWANAWIHKNIPTLQDGTRLNGVINVYFADNIVHQFFHSNKGKWFREKNAEGWTEWQQVATTTKTDILCTPKTGVTIVEQKSYMVNNVVYISIMFKKTDNSAINSIFSAINVPSFARPLMEISLSVMAVDTVENGIVNKSISCSLNTSGDIWVVSDTESVATQIRVNGVFVL